MIRRTLLVLIFVCTILCLCSSCFLSAFTYKNEDILLDREFHNSIPPAIIDTVNDDHVVSISYPRSSAPALVEKGMNFTIMFDSKSVDNLYVYLSTAFEPIVDEILLDVEGFTKNRGIWYANVLVPICTPVELYNLTVIVEQNGRFYSTSEPRAVSVYDEISNNFTFIHVADLHIGDPRGFFYNLKETIGYRSILKCIDEINLLHPDFVIISGDLVYGGIYPFSYSLEYKKCYELLQRFDVPTFLCPGNHDGYHRIRADGFEFWKRYFGPLYHSFDYGQFHFIAINSYDWPSYSRRTFGAPLNWGGSIQDEQLQWIEQDLKETNANLTFIFLHHNPLWETTTDSILRRPYYNRRNLLSLIENYDVDMVLAGHVHYDNITLINDTIYLTTTTPESDIRTKDGYWGYRRIEIENDQIESYNYKEPKYSIPSYRLNLTYKDLYTGVIENDLEQNITVLVKFILPLENYSTTIGYINMERANDYMVELYVEALVEKESTVDINIVPLS